MTIDGQAEVPLPPFTGLWAAQQFHRLVLVYVVELKQPDEPIGLHQFLLGQALHWHAPRDEAACAQCGPPYPCRTVLSVAAVARVPAPWTPIRLVRAMKAAGLLSDDARHVDSRTDLHLGGDGWFEPRVTATRDERTGGWELRSVERSTETTVRLIGDGAVCDYLFERARSHAYPYGCAVDPAASAALAPGSLARGHGGTSGSSHVLTYRGSDPTAPRCTPSDGLTEKPTITMYVSNAVTAR